MHRCVLFGGGVYFLPIFLPCLITLEKTARCPWSESGEGFWFRAASRVFEDGYVHVLMFFFSRSILPLKCVICFPFFFPFSLRLGWWVCILIFSFVVLGAKGLVAWTR